MKKIFLTLGIALMLSGCATASAHQAPNNSSPYGSWAFVTIDGIKPVSQNTRLDIGENIGIYVGCNRMSGKLRVEAGKLLASPLLRTKRYCQNIAAQEQAVSELFSSSPTYAVSGDSMTITSPTHNAQLVRSGK